MDEWERYAIGTLRDLRLERGVNQYQLAAAMGVSQKMVSLYEHRPLAATSLNTLRRRMDALQTDLVLCVLFRGEVVMLTDPPAVA